MFSCIYFQFFFGKHKPRQNLHRCLISWFIPPQVVCSFPLEWLQNMFWDGPQKCWQQKGQTSSSFDFGFSWIRCMNTMECFGWHFFRYPVCTCCFRFWISLGDTFVCFVGESCGSTKVSLKGGRGRGEEGTCQNVYSWSAWCSGHHNGATRS